MTFERTLCGCPRDVAFCLSFPGHLIPSDIMRIANELIRRRWIEKSDHVFRFLRASRGAVVADLQTGRVFRIGTITPRAENGQCVFLDQDNRCMIHAVAPFGCAHFDAHMPTEEADRRSLWGLRQIQFTPWYEELRQILMEGGEVDPVLDIMALNTSGKRRE